jgi:hypothetical protein
MEEKEENKKTKKTTQKNKDWSTGTAQTTEKNDFKLRGGGGISEKIFNDEPIIQESGCKHAINR